MRAILNKQNIIYASLLLGILALFAALSCARIHQTVSIEELNLMPIWQHAYTTGLWQALHAKDLHPLSPLIIHTPLYMYALLWAFSMWGCNEISARLVGILSLILTILLTFFAVYAFVAGQRVRRLRAALLVSACFALAPTTIQGANVLQIDTTVLVPLILCIGVCAAAYLNVRKRIWLLCLGVSIVLSLWARVFTTGVVMVLLAAYVWQSRAEASTKRAVIATIAAAAAGFWVSWFVYCRAWEISWLTPFTYTSSTLQIFSMRLLSQFAQNVFYLALWLGPVALISIFAITIYAIRAYLQREPNTGAYSLFLFCGMAILAGFTVFGCVNSGYPRYHGPAIPYLYIGAGILLSRQRGMYLSVRKTIVIFLLVFFAQMVVIGDPLYSIRYLLRESVVYAPWQALGIIKGFALRYALFVAICALLLLLVKPVRFSSVMQFLVICALASTTQITVSQSLADYNTGENYGERGMPEVIKYLSRRVDKESVVIAPYEVSYYRGLPYTAYTPNSIWTDKEARRRSLKDSRVSAVVFSIAANTVEQLKAPLQDEEFQRMLRAQFEGAQIGTYRVWTRKKAR